MAVEIRKVQTAKERRAFVKFPEKLYRHNPYYVPGLVFDELNTMNPKKNPAVDFCDFQCFLAYKDGQIAGRVCAIVNRLANQQWNHQEVRFGWLDFIDDREVSQALMDAVFQFGRERGMEYAVGPLGFTDFDPEGMLIDGFDQMSTMVTIYNHPYYPEHMDAMGFEKDADWLEYVLTVPEKLPEKYERVSRIVAERSNVHVKKVTKRIVRKEDLGHKIFHLLGEAYKNLYNYTVLPTEMADKYLDFYLSILDLRYITVLANEKDEIVALGITMPSLAKALQKSRGELFPFGWIPLLRDMYFGHSEGVDLLLIGVMPEYRNKGLNSLVIADMFRKYSKWGIKWAETTNELETNNKVQAQWEEIESKQNKRHRSYKIKL